MKLTAALFLAPPSDWFVADRLDEKFSHFAFTKPSPTADFSKHLVRTFNDGNPARYIDVQRLRIN